MSSKPAFTEYEKLKQISLQKRQNSCGGNPLVDIENLQYKQTTKAETLKLSPSKPIRGTGTHSWNGNEV